MCRPVIPYTPPNASVNRVRIVDLPGLPVDVEVRGRAAYQLLSSEAVLGYAQARAEALALDPAQLIDTPAARRAVPLRVDAALRSADVEARAAAQAIARRLGRNLGAILLTLQRGDAVNRAVRPDWTDAEWEQWGRIRHVWLGGGVLRGTLGSRLVEEARIFLEALGYGDVLAVDVTPYRGDLSLLGAARYFPATVRDVLCFDFGQTLVKRARLSFAEGVLVAAELLPALPTDWTVHNEPHNAARYSGAEVRDFVVELLARSVLETGVADAELLLSVAAYVRGGALLGNGIYARMRTPAADVRPLLEAEVHARTGRRFHIGLIHDGTAAAALYAGEPAAAVIVVGTALGVGFPQETAAGLRALSPTFMLKESLCGMPSQR